MVLWGDEAVGEPWLGDECSVVTVENGMDVGAGVGEGPDAQVSGKSNEDWNSQFLVTEGWLYPLQKPKVVAPGPEGV